MKDNQHEQLFSELTPAEAAVVEGGHLVIERIQAIKVGADTLGKDEIYITVDGTKKGGQYSMTTGQTRSVNLTWGDSGPSSRVRLFDADPGNDDRLGGFDAVDTNGALKQRQVSGSGSIYDVYYRTT